MFESVRPHRRQPTRLLGILQARTLESAAIYFSNQWMQVKSESEVAQSCLTLRDPMDCRPPVSSIHGIFQARVLEWAAIAFSEVRLDWWKEARSYRSFLCYFKEFIFPWQAMGSHSKCSRRGVNLYFYFKMYFYLSYRVKNECQMQKSTIRGECSIPVRIQRHSV